MINFHKYHGAGNDFIILDNRDGNFNLEDKDLIKTFCDRRFGVGADGMLLVQNKKGYDFEMVYINSDGSIGSMCGNGGRCIVDYAHRIIKIIPDIENIKFLAVDGVHEAKILENIDGKNLVKLKMQDVSEVGKRNGLTFLHSGTTPHHVQMVVNLETFPVCDEARKIRDKDSDTKGINVNYIEERDGVFYVRTYERGVEDETLACGTGATSVAIAMHDSGYTKENKIKIKMPGGDLEIEFTNSAPHKYENIWLTGPATMVYEGVWNENERYTPRFFNS